MTAEWYHRGAIARPLLYSCGMSAPSFGQYVIQLTPPEKRAEVLEYKLRPRGFPKAWIQTAVSSAAEMDGLIDARRGEKIVGVCRSEILPGRIASISSPTIDDAEADELAVDLLVEAVAYATSQRAQLARTLIGDPHGRIGAWYRIAGFHYLTDRIEMSCGIGRNHLHPSTAPLEFEAYSPATHARFVAIIERTYIDSQDCSQLNGLRKVEDVLDSYRSSGEFSSDRWVIARHENADVGCVIVTDYSIEERCELLYLGLVQEVRGRGWGLPLVRKAQWLTHQVYRDQLVLAVDSQNRPALKTYLAAGFVEVERQAVMVRVLT